MTRLLSIWFSTVGLALGFGCAKRAEPQPEILARIHFQGFERLDDATTLHRIWRLPETDALRGVALDKLANTWSVTLLPPAEGVDTSRFTWIRPLLDDALRSESFLEIVARSNSAPAWSFAIRLADDRAKLWQDHWAKLVETAQTNRHYGLSRGTNSWLVVGSDSGSAIQTPLWAEFTSGRAVNERGLATTTNSMWLEAELDGPQLGRIFPALADFALSTLNLTVRPAGKDIRAEARLHFAQPAHWVLESWRFPTNTIRDPLIGFTAARGFGPWLKRQGWFQRMGLASTPNQAVAWGQEDLPIQVQFAAPVENATNEIQRLATHWIPQVSSNWTHLPLEPLYVNTNSTLLTLRSMVIAPFLRCAPEPAAQFLNGGLFPLEISPTDPNTNAPPPELFAQVERTNLVFYNWEITQKKLGQWIYILSQANVLLTLPRMETNSLAYRWLDAMQSSLGNAITELTLTSATEASLVRRSHSGFNALELLAVANWVEGTNFPRPNLKFRFQPPRILPQNPAAQSPAPAP